MTGGADESRVRRDREALEAVLGFSVGDEPWPADALKPGTWVRVVKDPDWDGPWRQEFEGVIDTLRAPQVVTHAMATPGEYCYFVAFDEPQMDYTEDGPYRKAEVWARHLVPLEDP